jgi:hypothetical protein
MPDRPRIEVADVIRLAEVSASYGVPYVYPDEVRRMLAKMGFELAESESSSAVSVKGGDDK